MQKKSLLFIAILLLALPGIHAFTTTLTELNDTASTITISSSQDLYAYEINLDYTDAIISTDQVDVFSSCESSTSGTSEKDNIISVYASCLEANNPGLNISGELFNITYNGTVDLRFTLAVHGNGTEVYTFYNETTVTTSSSSGGGGGGGGGGGPAPNDFNLEPDLLQVLINQGDTTRQTFTITNNLNRVLEINAIEASASIDPFIILPDTPLTLLPGEAQEIEIDFFAPTTAAPDIFAGKITLQSATTTKSLNVLLEIKEDEPLFDVTIDLERENYDPGETVIATIDTINVGDLRNIDALIFYAIRDFDGNTIAFKEESYAIENFRIQLIGRLDVPQDAVPGDYVFYTRVSYADIIATGSQVFSIGEPLGLSPASSTFLYIAIAAVIIAIVIITIVLVIKLRKPSSTPASMNLKPQQPTQ